MVNGIAGMKFIGIYATPLRRSCLRKVVDVSSVRNMLLLRRCYWTGERVGSKVPVNI